MKLRSILAAAAVVVFSLQAQAQTDPSLFSEGQKRRLLLPSVRALTDCIARTIAADKGTLEMAKVGLWDEAARQTGKQCDGFVEAMVRHHDRLHGGGTGIVFFRGPYFADLPRALAARVQPLIDRQNIESARIERERRQQDEQAEDEKSKVIKESVAAHMACLKTAMIDLVPFSTESAEAVSTAIMTRCQEHERKRASLAVAVYSLPRDQIEKIISEHSEKARKNVLTDIVTLRAELARAKMETPAINPPASGTVPAVKSY